jgi:uroporphyrinogen decarboxylase-like protein
MNGKERVFAALRRQPSDVVPVTPCFPNIFLRQPEWAAYTKAYRARIGKDAEYRVRPEEDNQIILESKLKSLEAWQEMPDWIGVTRSPTREIQERSVIRERDGDLFLFDTDKQTELNLSNLVRGDSNELMQERTDDLSAMRELSHDEIDERVPIISCNDLLRSGAFLVPKMMMDRFRNDYFMHAVISTPYTSAKYVTGLVKMMYMLREEKAELHYIVDRCYQAALELTKAWAALGVYGIYFQETLSAADFIAPQDYDEFVYPTTKELVKECKALGMHAMLYMAGNSVPRVPQLAEMGLDALAVEESRKNFKVNIAQVRAQAGDGLALFGNIDAYGIMEVGSDEVLDAEISRQIREGSTRDGAFLMSTGSPITPDTSSARVKRFIQRTREFGKYPLGN